MAMIWNKLKIEMLTNKLEKINQEIDFEKDYLELIINELEAKKEKAVEKLDLKRKETLYPYEELTVSKEKLVIEENQNSLAAFDEKAKWTKRALIETKKRKSKKDKETAEIEYQNALDKLQLEKEQLEANLEAKRLAAKEYDESLTEEDKLNFQAAYDVKQEEMNAAFDTKKAELEEKVKEKYAKEKEKNDLHIEKLKDKKDILEKRLASLLENVEKQELPEDVILRLDALLMQFGGLRAVDNLSFDVKQGEIFGLIGPNGAGKTTVFNCITQFYKNYKGDIIYRNSANQVIRLNDEKVFNVIKHGIVRTFQNVELIWELSVLDNLLVAAHSMYKSSFLDHFVHSKRYRKEEQVIKAKAVKVLEYLDLLPYQYGIPFGLPYGILKRIELARTLMSNPKLIILDEPAAGLNEKETSDLASMILKIRKEFNVTIFLVEHDMSLVMDICDTVCAISFGKKLAIGTPQEIQSNATVQEAYLGGE